MCARGYGYEWVECACMYMYVHDVCLDEWCMHVYGCVRGRGSEWVCVRVCVGEVKIMGFERASL